MAFASVGSVLPGATRLGDGRVVFIRPLSRSVPVSYNIVTSKYGVSLPTSYSIIGRKVAPILAMYQTIPQFEFAINGDGSIINPDQLTYQLPQATGRTLLGGPLIQSYRSMVWTYSMLSWPEFQKLLSFYNPTNPVVLLTYPNEQGLWVQRQAVMLPPAYGTQQGPLVYGVTLSFTRL